MTDKEKQKIIELRNSGLGYGAIAMELGISKNVVSSFCHRYNIEFNKPQDNFCKNCGNKLVMIPKHKTKIFCSNKCRIAWWKSHTSEMKRRNPNVALCSYCKCEFTYYGKRQRKYCSRDCYLKSMRMNGNQDE